MFKKLLKLLRLCGALVCRSFTFRALLCRFVAVTIFSVASALLLGAQESIQSITFLTKSNGVQAPLSALVSRSEIIFSGTVVSVERKSVQNWTMVRFSVETCIRGCEPGLFEANFVESLPGAFPLRSGERVIAFLHGRNAAGLTSFVANGCGLFRRTGGDRVDLGRLQLCPALRLPSLLISPEPRAVWQDRNVLPGKSDTVALSSIGGRAPLRAGQLSTLLQGGATMDARDFLSLLSNLVGEPQIRDGVHAETRDKSDTYPSGGH